MGLRVCRVCLCKDVGALICRLRSFSTVYVGSFFATCEKIIIRSHRQRTRPPPAARPPACCQTPSLGGGLRHMRRVPSTNGDVIKTSI